MKPVLFLLLVLSQTVSTAQANSPIPDCLDHGTAVPVDNAEVIRWKTTTPNQTLERAHVEGTVDRVFPTRNGNNHFEIKIGPNADDTLEVVYNSNFGALPSLHEGMTIEACGEYITSMQAADGYEASPSGAIIHWVHRTTNETKHEGGYIAVEGKLFGQGSL